MKKILFLQNKGNSLGGVWYVNKTLGEELKKRGYDVTILSIRNDKSDIKIDDTSIELKVVNNNDLWEIVHRRDVLNKFMKRGFFKILKQYFSDRKKLNDDYKKMKLMIKEINPDYIIASHYQTLLGIPNDYLSRAVYVHHSTFSYLLKDKYNIKIVKKYNDKIYGFYWLSKSTMEEANKFGLKKNYYLYNPNKFIFNKNVDIFKNKKILAITRFAPEKRIDLMLEIVNDVFKNKKLKHWKFELYGSGELTEKSKEIISKSSQISYKGLTLNPLEILTTGSITLNTSLYEGLPLSIIEGYTCGLPVISFNFGDAIYEIIKNDYNGFIIENDNVEEFKNKLNDVLLNKELLEKLSAGAKDFSKNFTSQHIADKWEEVFKNIDKK